MYSTNSFIYIENQLKGTGHLLTSTWTTASILFLPAQVKEPHMETTYVQVLKPQNWNRDRYMGHKRLKGWCFPHHTLYPTCSICSDSLCFKEESLQMPLTQLLFPYLYFLVHTSFYCLSSYTGSFKIAVCQNCRQSTLTISQVWESSLSVPTYSNHRFSLTCI